MDKFNEKSIKKLIVPLIILAGFSNLFADDDKFFGYSGSVGTFNKIGINNQKVNAQEGIYPTESFSTIFGKLDTTYNFKSFFQSDYINKLEVGLGIAAGSLTWDSTKNDGLTFGGGTPNAFGSGSGLNNNYVGGWNGYFTNLDKFGYRPKNNRNYIIQNAYLNLESKYFNLKGGRYESDNDYHSGYTQGFQADIHFNYGDLAQNKDNEIKLWWFSTYGRAFAYSQWFLDFYAVKSSQKNNGDLVNLGIHSGGVDIIYGGIDKVGDYKDGYNLLVRPFVYFYPGLYTAPGAKLVYEKYFGNGYGLKTTIQGYALRIIRNSAITANNPNATDAPQRYDQDVDKLSGNLNVIVQGFIYDYNVRLGYYQNFGSANSHFGTYGNPLGLDFWTTSVYDIGANISDIISRNAKSVYLSGGGSHTLEYGKFAWEVLGRITKSPRSDEESVALYLSHTFNNNIAIGLKLEWLRDTTKAGFNPGASAPATTSPLSKTRTDDRSHAFITLDYNF
ncbi:outer membrane family protein [Helicobacter sp. MIT 14-3879]|uniref:outer membrane family protein n=1 Tax=Helicobacter sp. MIT 14-3879 TaxID=2040649 RepID=UPI000E1EAC99|nr:outer membrane family protein [Helicobacter sp. MIT 14-3879]RDU64005.1 hypothetical protein CQA44_05025 [Helicobacter sp. MIT 14-3879]